MAMRYGADAMRRPVEIEFAVNLNADKTGELYLLQIRPIVDSKQRLDENLSSIPDEQCLLRSHNSLGHGISDDVMDVVYVKTDSSFTAKDNPIIATEIERINKSSLISTLTTSLLVLVDGVLVIHGWVFLSNGHTFLQLESLLKRD